jgi:D-alanine-D-alanine ligase
LRIVLLIDEEMFDPDDPDFANHKPEKYFDSEFYVSLALRGMGHKVVAVPATADLAATLNKVKAFKPHLVFNLVEHVGGDRANDALMAGMLEVSQIPYTGAPPSVLTIARDKHLSKLIVASAGVRVPRSFVVADLPPPRRDDLCFPMIVKPLTLDGSEGIAADSYVRNWPELRRKINQQRRQASSHQMICEEYIDGREFIVTVSGVDTVAVDSIRELVFPPKAGVRFATERVKFDQDYKKRHGIHYRSPKRFIASLNGKVERAARDAYRALGIESYAKLEFRVRNDEVVFLEANPNSILSRKAATTDFASIGYERFIRKIMRMAFTRHARRAGPR